MPTSPTYDIHKSYDENYEQGPFFNTELPTLDASPKARFMDFAVGAPIGVPAGPLLNSNWVDLYAKLGFDLPVYKTVRSGQRDCHPAPNCIYLERPGNLTDNRFGERLLATEAAPQNPENISITNSFGMPSKAPDTWMADMEVAASACGSSQVFIASAVGTPGNGSLADDYARTAAMCKEAGAQVVEINLSCPNVTSGEGSIFTDASAARTIVKATADALGSTPLMVKVGYFTDADTMAAVVKACAPLVQGIAGINTLSFEVVKADGSQALPGEGRLRSGICGAAIRQCGLTQAERLVALRAKEQYDFVVVGVGGIMTPTDIDAYLGAGVDAVMSATGAMWNPYLAANWRNA